MLRPSAKERESASLTKRRPCVYVYACVCVCMFVYICVCVYSPVGAREQTKVSLLRRNPPWSLPGLKLANQVRLAGHHTPGNHQSCHHTRLLYKGPGDTGPKHFTYWVNSPAPVWKRFHTAILQERDWGQDSETGRTTHQTGLHTMHISCPLFKPKPQVRTPNIDVEGQWFMFFLMWGYWVNLLFLLFMTYLIGLWKTGG